MPPGTLATSRDIFIVTLGQGRGWVFWHLTDEARDVAKHPPMHRPALTAKSVRLRNLATV